MRIKNTNSPATLVIFGATGDLMTKKIVPALWHAHQSRQLPNFFAVLGFAHSDMDDHAIAEHIFSILKEKKLCADKNKCAGFLKLFHYQRGAFDEKSSYTALTRRLEDIDGQWKACANKLYYLAVPPKFMPAIVRNLQSAGLSEPCGEKGGWARLIVEKPFGSDGKSARDLERTLCVFKESQIYRIDHYLGKEMVQGILNFRFSNNILEPGWSNEQIERIDIQLLEEIGVEQRGSFYDNVGALRDVVQNHLMEIAALLTMDNPKVFSPDAIRAARAEALSRMRIDARAGADSALRGQYEGYKDISGVRKNSQTETYCKIKLEIDHPRWRGVPIIIEAGKRIGSPMKRATVTYRHPRPCLLCPTGKHTDNQVIFSIAPEQCIQIGFWAKKPGIEPLLENRTLDFMLYKRKTKVQYAEEYAKLLVDCIAGNQTWFVGKNEIRQAWRIVDPVQKMWNSGTPALERYAPDSDAIVRENRAREVEMRERPKHIGLVGLGRMGGGIAQHLMERRWNVVGYNKSPQETRRLADMGMDGAYSLRELVSKLPAGSPRIVWLMIPAGKPVDSVLFDARDGLIRFLNRGDIVIDGGNSYYKDTIRRALKLKKYGIRFLDCGVSGGPSGARDGACLMAGGDKKTFREIEYLFSDLARANGYQFFEGAGAGHFVKMVHNGIEYGMMQALGEGFEILKKTRFRLDVKRVADIYNSGSVIESRLTKWLFSALDEYGDELSRISGRVAHSGEGEWTVKTAHALKVRDKVIHEAFKFRVYSAKHPSYAGKIVSALRGQFGEHPVLE